MKRALITGVSGQDGVYLSELLLAKGYKVYGIARGSSPARTSKDVQFSELEITDFPGLSSLIRDIRPEEIYNLAGQSHVNASFDQVLPTVRSVGIGAANIFEAVRLECPAARVFQASSSEMYGNCVDDDGFQRESTPMNPVSPYGSAKLFAYHIARNYRLAHKLFITNGIMFNHESPLRGADFVTSKICREAVRIKFGLTDRLNIGNMDARRDWGHAKDAVRAMWQMLQRNEPDDFVCATGVMHSVREVVDHVFGRLGLNADCVLTDDPSFLRADDRRMSRGDSEKLRAATGWAPEYTFEAMLDEMIEHWQSALSGPGGRCCRHPHVSNGL